jgi:hypothetical protein
MPRKTAIYGFNLFYHDESVLSAEDIRPGSSYTGTLQPDPTNTLNFNFKLMEDLIQDVLNGTLAFTKVRAVQDVEAGRDVVVGRYLVLNPEYGIVLARDRRPTPHILLDFGDALVHAGYDDTRSVSLSVGGNAQNDAERLRPFTPDTQGRRFQGASVYPVVYTVSTAGTLLETGFAANARLFLAFTGAPQGLSAVRLEASYDGSTYTLLGYYIQDLARSSLLFDEVTFAQGPKALRVTLEGTNSTSTDFTLTRLALLHAGTPALEGFYLPRRGGQLWGDLLLPASKLIFGADTNLYRSAADTLKTDDSLVVGGTVQAPQFVSTATSGTAPFQVNSSTAVPNLNADLLDGLHAASFARVDASSTISQPWTLNANLTVGAGYTLDGVDLSVFKAAYDAHEHDGTDAPKVRAGNVLAKAFDQANFPGNNNPYTYNVQSYLDALQDQINDLVTGTATFDNLLVKNLNFTVGGTFTASGVTLNAGGLSLTGNAQAVQLVSTAAQGTAPLQVVSSTKVTSLNADLLDGYDASDFPRKAENATVTGSWTFNSNVTVSGNVQGVQLVSTAASGTAPLQVVSTTKVANLNADLLDGYDSSDFARKAENATVTGAWTFSNVLTVNNTLGATLLQTKVGTSGGGSTHLQLFGSGSLRWGLGLQGTESSGNVGSDFTVWRYDNGGTYLAKALNINRATGQFTVYGNLEVAKQGNSSLILFPAQTNDPGYIEHWENNNVSRMRFVNSDDPNTTDDYFEWGADNSARDSFTARMRLYNSGKLALYGEGKLELKDSSTSLSQGPGSSLRITTPTGYVDVGSQNASFVHFYTDRPAFFFGKDVHISGKVQVYNSNTWLETSAGYIANNPIWHNGNMDYMPNSNGYIRFPNGLVMAWAVGSWTETGEVEETLTLGYTFTVVHTVQVSVEVDGSSWSEDVWYQFRSLYGNQLKVFRQQANSNSGAVRTRPNVLVIGY